MPPPHPLPRKRLGRAGPMVSCIGLGCGTIGGVGSSPAARGRGMSEAEGRAMMDRAVAMGINLFDTANAYAGGDSERAIGRWLRDRGASVRDGLILATKVRNPVSEAPEDQGLSRRHVLEQCEASLRRLGTDRIDLYLSHAPDPSVPLEETLGAFEELVRAGKVRFVGACNLDADGLAAHLAIARAGGHDPIVCVQNEFNLLAQQDDEEVLPACTEHGVGYQAFSPLAGGVLTGKYRRDEPAPAGSRLEVQGRAPDPARLDAVDRLATLATDRGVSSAGLALAFVMSHPSITMPLVAPRRPGHFEALEEALRLELGAEERQLLAANVGA